MDDPGYLTMSTKELNRLEVLNRVLDRRLSQAQAAEQLGLGIRQVQRLRRSLRSEGPRGLVSRKPGRTSKRKLPDDLRRRAVDLIVSRYSDFGPTLADEKLRAVHGVAVSVETLRRVTQADIVSNKHLGAVLAKIQADQRERDQQRLSSPKVTLREKRQIRAGRARTDAPVNP